MENGRDRQQELIDQSPCQNFYCSCALCSSYWALNISKYPRHRQGKYVDPQTDPKPKQLITT